MNDHLPPLPEPFDAYRNLFVPTQMRDYALAAIAPYKAEIEKRPSKRLWDETATALGILRGKFHEVKTENDKLRALLIQAKAVIATDPIFNRLVKRINAALGEKK